MQPDAKPRAPAARAKLEQAQAVLADLEQQTAVLALEAIEGKAGAEKVLAAHRSRIESAERQAREMRGAVVLAERLDREAVASDAAQTRAEQLAEFKNAQAGRVSAMAKVLDALSELAISYAEYSEATQAAQVAMPSGTHPATINMGPLGTYGHSFGPCSQMLLAELYRVAPERKDGIGRFILPFAKSPLHSSTNHKELPAAIDEFRKTTEIVTQDIQSQVEKLNANEMAVASKAAA
jgi:hypothetical protein